MARHVTHVTVLLLVTHVTVLLHVTRAVVLLHVMRVYMCFCVVGCRLLRPGDRGTLPAFARQRVPEQRLTAGWGRVVVVVAYTHTATSRCVGRRVVVVA